jgi:hypothetical protein
MIGLAPSPQPALPATPLPQQEEDVYRFEFQQAFSIVAERKGFYPRRR